MTNALSEGDVIVYPYRWVSERDEDRSPDGSKDRPCCLVLLISDAAGRPTIILAPISSKPPHAGQVALEIPETERRRAGLGKYPQAWVYVDEVNADLLNESWYLQPQTPLGSFGRSYLAKIAAGVRANVGKGRAVTRR
jgi:hypothetical protein